LPCSYFTSTLFFSAHTFNEDSLGPQVITAYKLLPVHSGILSKTKNIHTSKCYKRKSFSHAFMLIVLLITALL